jgi:hypothetical protein
MRFVGVVVVEVEAVVWEGRRGGGPISMTRGKRWEGRCRRERERASRRMNVPSVVSGGHGRRTWWFIEVLVGFRGYVALGEADLLLFHFGPIWGTPKHNLFNLIY